MSRFYRCIILLLPYIIVLMPSACKSKDDPDDGKQYMYGLNQDTPQYVEISRSYTFSAFGIDTPEEGITYTWVAEGFTPDTCVAQSSIFVAPSVAGTYSVSVTASHEDYYSSYSIHYVTVIDTTFTICLPEVVRGTDSIVDLRDGRQYYTRMYGQSEWFVQNLSWEGSGNPYGKEKALEIPLGRLYSWNEATSGACPDGWDVPTNADWAALATEINGGTPLSFFDDWAGIADPLCAYVKLNDDYLWPYSPRNLKSNTAAWNGLPAGNSANYGNNFSNLSTYGFWWSADEADETNAYYRYIHYDNDLFPYHITDKESFGASVRCVRVVNEVE